MGRPYEFPDPKDRSVNNPHVLIERDAILGLYNQANPSNTYANLAEAVRDWFEAEAKRAGWVSVQFVDQAAVLTANIALVPVSQIHPAPASQTIVPTPVQTPVATPTATPSTTPPEPIRLPS